MKKITKQKDIKTFFLRSLKEHSKDSYYDFYHSYNSNRLETKVLCDKLFKSFKPIKFLNNLDKQICLGLKFYFLVYPIIKELDYKWDKSFECLYLKRFKIKTEEERERFFSFCKKYAITTEFHHTDNFIKDYIQVNECYLLSHNHNLCHSDMSYPHLSLDKFIRIYESIADEINNDKIPFSRKIKHFLDLLFL